MRLTVSMTNITVPQALTLKAMFEYWNTLSKMGGSQHVSFFVDGDGDFHPQCAVMVDGVLPELTAALRERALVEGLGDTRCYDPDGIAWALEEDEMVGICDGCGTEEEDAHHQPSCKRPGFTKVRKGKG